MFFGNALVTCCLAIGLLSSTIQEVQVSPPVDCLYGDFGTVETDFFLRTFEQALDDYYLFMCEFDFFYKFDPIYVSEFHVNRVRKNVADVRLCVNYDSYGVNYWLVYKIKLDIDQYHSDRENYIQSTRFLALGAYANMGQRINDRQIEAIIIMQSWNQY